MLTMIGFTLFLIYTALFRNDANCHCFGSFIEVDPVGSIFKNIAIIVLLLFVKKQEDWNFKYKKWMIAGFLILGLISTFVFFPPDALYNKIYKPKSKVNPVVFEYIVKDSAKVGLSEIQGKHILAFYISGCKFCKMSMQKVDNIFKRNGIAEEKFVAIIAGGPKQVESFKKETQSEKYNMYAHKSAVQFLNAVYGSFPTIIYMNGDSIVKVINYRGIDEAEMVKFLKE
jgi:thiol-disulfide isomerase/thioredoxin